MRRCWERDMAQPLQTTVRRFLKKESTELPRGPRIPPARVGTPHTDNGGSNENLHRNIHGSTNCNRHKEETTPRSIGG